MNEPRGQSLGDFAGLFYFYHMENENKTIQTFEYGAMSSKYSLQASNKLTAYVAMCVHFDAQANLIAIFSPEESKNDSWLSLDGKISDRLDEIFIANSGLTFDAYIENNVQEIRSCYKTIKKII